MTPRFDSWEDFVPDPTMSYSKKIAEAFENLEVSLKVSAESVADLCKHLKATDGTAIALVDRIAESFKQIVTDFNKTDAIVKAAASERMEKERELWRAIDALKKKIEGGDSWRGEG